MYRTCLFCNKSLQTNEVVEAFPVGRRLAFDSSRGRLWVVCRHCERWNLTPLEERWEAVETCEKLFRGTRLRTSSENIGLAKHPEGLELVRIGEPLRPEFAAWRYGDQFGRRRRRHTIIWSAAGVAWVGGIVLTSSIAVGGFMAGFLAMLPYSAIQTWHGSRQVARFAHSDGEVRALTREARKTTRVVPADDEIGFRIEVHLGKHLKPGSRFWADKREWFEGEDARRAMNAVLRLINFGGAGTEEVKRAVSQIESHRHPDAFLNDVLGRDVYRNSTGTPGWIHKMPKPTRLALEMAVHEEDERRALEGELWRLEQAWRDAEEIAAISDDLLLPKGAEEFMARERGRDKEEES